MQMNVTGGQLTSWLMTWLTTWLMSWQTSWQTAWQSAWQTIGLPDFWTALGLVMASLAALFSALAYVSLRRRGRLQKPFAALDIRALPDHPGWYRAQLTVINNMPYVVVAESARIVKPSRGVGVRSDGEAEGSPREGEAPVATARQVTLDFEIARAGHRAVPIRGTTLTTSGEKQSRVFFIQNTRRKPPRKLTFEVVIAVKDYDRTMMKIAVPARLPA